MEITAAIICDYAQVRDRLLFVSSGAVSRLYRDSLPAVLGVNMALIVRIGTESAGVPQKLSVAVVNRHGRELSRVVTTFRVGDAGLFPHEIQQVPMVVNTAATPVHTWGTHQFRIYLNDELAKTAACYVIPTSGVFDDDATQAAVAPEEASAADGEGEGATDEVEAAPAGESAAPDQDGDRDEPEEVDVDEPEASDDEPEEVDVDEPEASDDEPEEVDVDELAEESDHEPEDDDDNEPEEADVAPADEPSEVNEIDEGDGEGASERDAPGDEDR